MLFPAVHIQAVHSPMVGDASMFLQISASAALPIGAPGHQHHYCPAHHLFKLYTGLDGQHA